MYVHMLYYIYIYIYIYISVCVCVCMYIYIYIYVYIYICMHPCMHTFLALALDTACMHTYIHTYIHTYTKCINGEILGPGRSAGCRDHLAVMSQARNPTKPPTSSQANRERKHQNKAKSTEVLVQCGPMRAEDSKLNPHPSPGPAPSFVRAAAAVSRTSGVPKVTEGGVATLQTLAHSVHIMA